MKKALWVLSIAALASLQVEASNWKSFLGLGESASQAVKKAQAGQNTKLSLTTQAINNEYSNDSAVTHSYTLDDSETLRTLIEAENLADLSGEHATLHILGITSGEKSESDEDDEPHTYKNQPEEFSLSMVRVWSWWPLPS